MEFRFRAGDRGPSSSASGDSPPVPRSNPHNGCFGGPGLQGPLPPPPPSIEWEAARREGIIQMEVRRRLIEEEVRREFEAKGNLAFAQAHRAGFLPDPFFPPGHLMPPMAMHPPPHALPPMPFDQLGAWHGFNQFGPRPHAGFGERMPLHCEERRLSPPRPKPKHKLQLLEIEPSGRPEAPSSKTKVQRMKRKADTIVGPTVPKNVPKKVQKLTKDWSCALCQVSATCEAGLNEHLEGKKHKAKFAQCGTSKVITDSKDNLRKITGNKSGIEPCDEPKKICILVDGELHEVVQKNNYLWCDRCKVRCDSNVTMAGHLRSKKHNKRNKVWSSIEAVRMDTKINEDLSSPCESKLTHGAPAMMMPVDKRGADTELDDLPEDLVTDKILMLLPPKDVGRCRAVRASWRSATSTLEFMLAHHRRQPSFPIVEREYRLGVFRASRSSGTAYLQPLCPRGHNVSLHAAGDGFLVMSVPSRFYIYNPVINQIAPLPQPEFQHTNTILGLYSHDATGEYRVLWSSVVDRTQNERTLHVTTVGSNQSRDIGVRMSTAASSPSRERALLEALPRDRYSAYNPPVRHRGNLHWMPEREIIVFDTATELFQCMRGATHSGSRQKLFDVHGKLGLYSPDTRFKYMDVWVMEDYEAEMWEFKYRIDMSSIEASLPLHLTSPKMEKRKGTVVAINPMARIISEMCMLNEHELLFGYNDKHVLRCNIDGKLLGAANIERRQYIMELTHHRFKESIIPIPSSKMQEER